MGHSFVTVIISACFGILYVHKIYVKGVSRTMYRNICCPQILLREISTHLVAERPGRNEPRAVTRERKHYPKLRTTREQWRVAYAA